MWWPRVTLQSQWSLITPWTRWCRRQVLLCSPAGSPPPLHSPAQCHGTERESGIDDDNLTDHWSLIWFTAVITISSSLVSECQVMVPVSCCHGSESLMQGDTGVRSLLRGLPVSRAGQQSSLSSSLRQNLASLTDLSTPGSHEVTGVYSVTEIKFKMINKWFDYKYTPVLKVRKLFSTAWPQVILHPPMLGTRTEADCPLLTRGSASSPMVHWS